MAKEDDQKLQDMLRAIELGELPEDLNDPEDYDDMGGIKSLDRGAPSIKMASEPEDEFELELGTVIKEYFDLKEKGIIDIPIEEFINQYLSKKKMQENRAMAMGGGMMRMGYKKGGSAYEEYKQDLEDGIISPDTTFNEWLDNNAPDPDMDLVSKKKKDRAMAMGGGPMRMPYAEGKSVKDLNVYDVVDKDKEDEYYKIKEEQMLRKYYPEDYPPSQRTMGMEDLRKMIKKAEQDKKKLAMGGIAGVL